MLVGVLSARFNAFQGVCARELLMGVPSARLDVFRRACARIARGGPRHNPPNTLVYSNRPYPIVILHLWRFGNALEMLGVYALYAFMCRVSFSRYIPGTAFRRTYALK